MAAPSPDAPLFSPPNMTAMRTGLPRCTTIRSVIVTALICSPLRNVPFVLARSTSRQPPSTGDAHMRARDALIADPICEGSSRPMVMGGPSVGSAWNGGSSPQVIVSGDVRSWSLCARSAPPDAHQLRRRRAAKRSASTRCGETGSQWGFILT